MDASEPQLVESLEAARDAVARLAWREAYEAYSSLDRDGLGPADLERFGEAAWWRGRLQEAIGLREQAYAGFSGAGDDLAAARVALVLSDDHAGRGAFAVSGGWFATAERLLATQAEGAEHARLALTQAISAMFAAGDLPAAIGHFDRAHELARRFRDRDTQALAVVGKGRALVKSGELEAGLALLDEATASAVGGELRALSTAVVYCMTISSCQDVGDYRRAAEWTEEANRWCDRLDVSGFPGACRVHRAELLRLRGDLRAAEKQALEACEELADYERTVTAGGWYEIGEIRRRRGDLAGAEDAYRRADELGRDPQPGLALLRLAEGRVDAAAAAIARSLADVDQPLTRLRRLPAQVEIAVAASNLPVARAAAEELERIVDAYKLGGQRATAFDATVGMAIGQIQLAEGDVAAAVGSLRKARDDWKRVGAPYETAEARMALGVAFRRLGDEHAATAELEAALATIERLDARLHESRLKELLGRVRMKRTFVFTDIVDSTRLLETLGNEKWKKLLARHDELLRERIVDSGGEVIKQTGDGFFAAFDSPRRAVEAAVAIQRALDAEIVAPDVRIGAHTGDAFRTGDGARDYGGEGVHLAARIGAAAAAAEVLVSRETVEGVEVGFRLSKVRSVTLQGFDGPVEVVSVEWR
jgi:class 3 adenylate cyclase